MRSRPPTDRPRQRSRLAPEGGRLGRLVASIGLYLVMVSPIALSTALASASATSSPVVDAEAITASSDPTTSSSTTIPSTATSSSTTAPSTESSLSTDSTPSPESRSATTPPTNPDCPEETSTVPQEPCPTTTSAADPSTTTSTNTTTILGSSSATGSTAVSAPPTPTITDSTSTSGVAGPDPDPTDDSDSDGDGYGDGDPGGDPSSTTTPPPSRPPTTPAAPTTRATVEPSASSVTAPTTTTTASDPLDPPERLTTGERRNRCNERARTAQVHYQPLKEMVVGQTERIQAAAVIPGSSESPELTGDEMQVAVDATLGCLVQAQLRGIGFDIDPGDWTALQSFVDTDVIRWEWLVSPKEKGIHPITLEIRSFLIEDDGTHSPSGDLPPVELDIRVTVEESLGERLTRLFRDFWSHPFWAALGGAAVLAGAVAAAWRLVTSRWPWATDGFTWPGPGVHGRRPPAPPRPPAVDRSATTVEVVDEGDAT